MRKRSCATLVVATMVVGSAIFAASPAHGLTSHESGFLSLTNRERASRGISTLSVAGDLTSLARAHSRRMAEDRAIYHRSSLSSGVDGNWRKLGENVGRGPSVRSIHNAFMSSSSHRTHILDRDYNQVGIGTAVKDDVIYVTEIFADRSAARKRVVVRRSVAPRRPVVRAKTVAKKPAPPPPPPPPAVPEPQIVTMLLVLAGLDAEIVDPRTGIALAPPQAVTLRQTPA